MIHIQDVDQCWMFYVGDKVELIPCEALRRGKPVGIVYEVSKTSSCRDKIWLVGEGAGAFDYFDKEKLVIKERKFIKNEGFNPVKPNFFVEVLTAKRAETEKQYCGMGRSDSFDWSLEPKDEKAIVVDSWHINSFDLEDNIKLRHTFFEDDEVVFFNPSKKSDVELAENELYTVARCRDGELELKGLDGVFDPSDFIVHSRAFQSESLRRSVSELVIIEAELLSKELVIGLSLHVNWHLEDAKKQGISEKVVSWRVFNC